MFTDITGKVMERFAYGTYGELLSDVKNSIRFLYNGAYGVTTDENGLYYMRARYYNSDIKRFINQDIKVGDIGNSQGLNRYAYCEGNPVNMADPFGLCGEDTQDQGKKSKYEFWHNVLDIAGLFFDGADIINAAIYAAEGDWGNAVLCALSAIPAVGSAIAGVVKSTKAVVKAKKAAKIASLAAEASEMTRKAGNTLDTISDTMKAASKWGDNPLKLADGITAEAGSKAMKALETGGDFAKESNKAVWEMKAVVGADGVKLSTSADTSASLFKNGLAKTDGVAKSAKSAKKSNTGFVKYGELDSLGRATGIEATITADMIGTGTKANASIIPTGFAGGGPGSPGHARGHLLGKQLGGSGDDSRNLVTLFQTPVNSPIMRDYENSIRKAVEDGEIVKYSVTPMYNGNELIPRGITLNASGSGGFSLNVTILNRKY